MSQRLAAQMVLTRRHALAQAAVARQYDNHPEYFERYGPSGRDKCVQDTEYHLSYLATALTYSSILLFQDYISWAKTILSVRNINLENIHDNIGSLHAILQEHLPREMAEAVLPYLDVALRVPLMRPSALPSLFADDLPITAIAHQYFRALINSNREEAARIIRSAICSGVPIFDVYLDVFQRCQREVGRLWQLNQLTVAQEHYCTAATQFVMAQLYPYLFSLRSNGRRLVAASVAGELHEMGLRVVADVFESSGWDTFYYGANIPASSLVRNIEKHKPDILAISVTMAFYVQGVEDLIALVRSNVNMQNVKILVGGYPFNVDGELWQKVGADASASDAIEALRTADDLLATVPPTGKHDPQREPANIFGGHGQFLETAGMYHEISRLNNDLVTAQRQLAKQNASLAQEIKNRQRLEVKARRVQKIKSVGQLAADVARSLNKLTTTMLGDSEMMLATMTADDPNYAGIVEIQRTASQTAAIAQKLLASSQKQLRKLPRVDLNALIGDLETKLGSLLDRVKLVKTLEPGLAPTHIDRDHLEEALVALLRNALTAVRPGSQLSIQTATVQLGAAFVLKHPDVRPGPYVMVSVSAKGVSRSQKARRQIFEPLKGSRTEGPGRGRVVPSLYLLVKQCGGEIDIDTASPAGSTIRLYFPEDESPRLKSS